MPAQAHQRHYQKVSPGFRGRFYCTFAGEIGKIVDAGDRRARDAVAALRFGGDGARLAEDFCDDGGNAPHVDGAVARSGADKGIGRVEPNRIY